MVALSWEVEGEGGPRPPVVLLPEASRPAAAWPSALLSGLVAAGHPVVRLDLRDQGRSPWPEEPYALADLAGDVAAVLAALARADLGGAHLVGWGLGGAVAIELALGGAGLSGLTLVGTSGWVVDPRLPGPDETTAVALVWRTRGGTAPDVLVRALGREHRVLCGPVDRPDAAAAQDEASRWLDWGFNPHDRQRAAWLAAPSRWEALERGLALPVGVVHGAEDPLVPLAHGRRLAEALAAPLVEVPGAGHELTPLLAEAVLAAVPRAAQRPARR